MSEWLTNALGMADGERIAIQGYAMMRTPENRGHVLQWYMTLPKSKADTILKLMATHHVMAQRVGRGQNPEDPAFHETLVQLEEESGQKNIQVAISKLSELEGYNGLWATGQGISARFSAAGIVKARKLHGNKVEKALNEKCTAVMGKKTFLIEGVPALTTSAALQSELCATRDDKWTGWNVLPMRIQYRNQYDGTEKWLVKADVGPPLDRLVIRQEGNVYWKMDIMEEPEPWQKQSK